MNALLRPRTIAHAAVRTASGESYRFCINDNGGVHSVTPVHGSLYPNVDTFRKLKALAAEIVNTLSEEQHAH
jgi:hypothetical protein